MHLHKSFFVTLFTFTAITSTIAMVEVIVANGIDLNNWSMLPQPTQLAYTPFLSAFQACSPSPIQAV